jgi:Tfp pilus assembly protein PilW
VNTSDEGGFTLVELVVATTVSLIITGVLVTCVIVGLKNADAAGQRLFNSHDAQIAQSFFSTDATSADLVDVSAGDTTCAGAMGDTLLARFRWTVRPADPTQSLTYEVAAYRLRTSGSESQLVREFCSGSSFAGAVDLGASVLAHGLDPATNPTVSCTFAGLPAQASCSTVAANKPFLTVRINATSTQKSTESSDSLAFSLTATRRSVQ